MKTAIVLMNLGGPDRIEAVKPFLFNLFNDPAIISLPNPFRYLLAKFISGRRTAKASGIYQQMGGKSPILEETIEQANALEKRLLGYGDYKVFINMRYWHPMVEETMQSVMDYNPDKVILLPLYPQYSTTTTESSVKNWLRYAKKMGFDKPTNVVCCYPQEDGFIGAYADLVKLQYDEAAKYGVPRVLFSAHGIPMNRVEKGDPYQIHVEATVAAIVAKLGISGLDYLVSYQSKVGPLQWLGPSTEDEITSAAKLMRPIVVVPIAFVSEHSETLVELDIEYQELAHENGCEHYFRVPTVGTHDEFIACLAQLCLKGKAIQSSCTGAGGCKLFST